jgi:hypothetical protein
MSVAAKEKAIEHRGGLLVEIAAGKDQPAIGNPARYCSERLKGMDAALNRISARWTVSSSLPEAPSPTGATNLAALNTANAIDAWADGIVVGAGLGRLFAVWAGFTLTLLGLIIFGLPLRKRSQFAPV